MATTRMAWFRVLGGAKLTSDGLWGRSLRTFTVILGCALLTLPSPETKAQSANDEQSELYRTLRFQGQALVRIVGLQATDQVALGGATVSRLGDGYPFPAGEHQLEVIRGDARFSVSVSGMAGEVVDVQLPALLRIRPVLSVQVIVGGGVQMPLTVGEAELFDVPSGAATEIVASAFLREEYKTTVTPGPGEILEMSIGADELPLTPEGERIQAHKSGRAMGWKAVIGGLAAGIAAGVGASQRSAKLQEADDAFARYQAAQDVPGLDLARQQTADHESSASTWGGVSMGAGATSVGLLGWGLYLILTNPSQPDEAPSPQPTDVWRFIPWADTDSVGASLSLEL